ncbi:MAG: hypothetical protein ACD_79C01188G0001 [uncultured bacterium]|nr:MAG: hypothetical protein ACD_79C01188G0001 [uncultured bacterium]
MSEGFLSLKDMAKKYNMTEKSLKKILEENRIPNTSQPDAGVVYNVKAFDRWLAANIKNLSSEKLEEIEVDDKQKSPSIHLLLNEQRVLFNPPYSTKMQVLNGLVETLVESEGIKKKDAKAVLGAIIERERLCSTAITDGVAIPHPRSSMEKFVKEPLLVLAISKKGIHFESDDGKHTNLFFLICADSIDIHLKVMAKLSRLLRSPKFRHEIIISPDFKTVYEVIEKWEKNLNK